MTAIGRTESVAAYVGERLLSARPDVQPQQAVEIIAEVLESIWKQPPR
jgi:hypothetical protein